jgi:hypothetical protein
VVGRNVETVATPQPTEVNAGQWVPAPPNLGLDLIKLFAWIKKHGSSWPLRQCQTKWNQLGHNGEDLEKIIRKIGRNDLITLGKIGSSETIVQIVDRPWADDWASYYHVELPHHGMRAGQSKEVNKFIKK